MPGGGFRWYRYRTVCVDRRGDLLMWLIRCVCFVIDGRLAVDVVRRDKPKAQPRRIVDNSARGGWECTGHLHFNLEATSLPFVTLSVLTNKCRCKSWIIY